MTKGELKKFKETLEAKQAELEQFVRNREGIAIEKSPDALDEVQHAAERELAIRNLDRESQLLRNVRAALRRIDEGTFGICVHCEEEISPKRLAAVPWAPFVFGARSRPIASMTMDTNCFTRGSSTLPDLYPEAFQP